MKKLSLVFLILVAILGFGACGDSKDSKDSRESQTTNANDSQGESNADLDESQMPIDDTEFEMPDYFEEWVGVYEFSTTQNGKPIKHIFKIGNHCSHSHQTFGGYYCEVWYAKNGSAFDDWQTNFFAKKPYNDITEYHFVPVIVFQSDTIATIQTFSLKYNESFCSILVERQGKIITLSSSDCYYEFDLHSEILGKYVKVLGNQSVESADDSNANSRESNGDSKDSRESKSQ